MIVTMQRRPVDPVFRHAVSTPQRRLETLADATRHFLRRQPDGAPLAVLADEIGATEHEVCDVIQELGKAVVLYWPARGWRVRLRTAGEQRLIAANDNHGREKAA
jgi:hypothetical protein